MMKEALGNYDFMQGDSSTNVTTATGLAWKSGVAAEVLCVPNFSIGTRILNTKQYVEIPDLFAWTAVVVVLSLLLEKLLRFMLERQKGGV